MALTKSKKTGEDLAKLPILGNQPTSESEEKFLREVCEYEFLNIEENGLSIKFPYGDTTNQHNFTFFHGGKYQVPRFVARHLESKTTPIWKWRPDGTGRMVKQMTGNKPRFQMRQVYG